MCIDARRCRMAVEMDAERAFAKWADGLISAALLSELTLAAAESQVSLTRFVAEVLESFAAARRLPKVPHSQVHYPRAERCAAEDSFPYPADVYPISRLSRSRF